MLKVKDMRAKMSVRGGGRQLVEEGGTIWATKTVSHEANTYKEFSSPRGS